MIVALDANCLVSWASRSESDALDRARLDHLLVQVAAAGGKVVIPAPAFAEFLVGIDEAASEWINVLDRKRSIVVAPFDRRAAFECSLLDKAAIGQGDKPGVAMKRGSVSRWIGKSSRWRVSTARRSSWRTTRDCVRPRPRLA